MNKIRLTWNEIAKILVFGGAFTAYRVLFANDFSADDWVMIAVVVSLLAGENVWDVIQRARGVK